VWCVWPVLADGITCNGDQDAVTFVALVAIIALAAGGLIVLMLAITHVERIDEAEAPVSSAPPPRRTIQTGRTMQAPSHAPTPREARDMGTARAPKPARRPAWHRIPQAWTLWWLTHAHNLLHLRVRHRRWAHYKGRVGGPAAVLAFAVVLGYLVAHI